MAELSTVALSIRTVRARVSRPVRVLHVRVPGGVGMTRGDSVFHTTAAGLTRVGEVSAVSERTCTLAIAPAIRA